MSLRCVIAEEFAVLRRTVKNALRAAGCDEIVEARDGLHALEACTADTRLLVTGWTLSDLGGLELVRRLRAAPQTANLRVLLLTGRRTREEVQQARDAGVDTYVIKPVSTEELQRRIRALLEESPAEDAPAQAA